MERHVRTGNPRFEASFLNNEETTKKRKRIVCGHKFAVTRRLICGLAYAKQSQTVAHPFALLS